MPTDKSQKPLIPKSTGAQSRDGKKILEKTEKLFSDLENLTTEEPADQVNKRRKKSIVTASPPLENTRKMPQYELADLRTRIHELEEELKGTKKNAPKIYARERIGYAYKSEALETLQGDQLEEKTTSENGIQIPLIVTGQTIGSMQVEATPEHSWEAEEESLAAAVAQQASLQIQSLRLLADAERAREEAESATRQFMHENWDTYLDAIHQNEKIGYAYDQDSVTPYLSKPSPDADLSETVKVMDEQVGILSLKHDPSRPFTEDDRMMVSSVANQVAQQVENIRLLADASRARAEAEEATQRLTTASWQEFTEHHQEDVFGFVYDSVKVAPLADSTLPENISLKIPLEVRGKAIGELAIVGKDKLPSESTELASAIAAQVNTHIENIRLLEETERGRQQLDKRAAELETVAKVSTAAAAIRDPESLLRSVVDLTNYSFKLYHTSVYLVEKTEYDTEILKLIAASGKTGHKMLERGYSLEVTESLPIFSQKGVLKNAYIANKTESRPVFLSHPFLPETRSEMAIPMVVADQLIGVFDVQARAENRFTEDDIRTYSTLASQTAVALQNAQLYEEQIETVERLRELDHLKSSFLANMSHELRTPLNSISGFTQVMLEGLDGPLSSEMEEDLGLIDKNAGHLLRLINEVLDMAKIEAGNLMVVLGPSNLYQMLEEVIKTTSALAHKNKLTISLVNNLPEDLIVMADDMRIQQVMINLIGNAMKFTPEGGITIFSEIDNDIIRIKVVDTGMGIPPELLESIFEAFSQVDTTTTRKVGGTGLGLPISKKFIEMHNGQLWAESSGISGEGSVFTLEIPVIMPEEKEA